MTIVNKKIEKYLRVIKCLYIVSLIVSVLVVISQWIDNKINGEWYMWKDIYLSDALDENLINLYILNILCSPVLTILVGSFFWDRFALRIDSAKIKECVKADKNLDSIRIKINLHVSDIVCICFHVIVDLCFAFFHAMFNSAFFTNGYFSIIFVRYWCSCIATHLCSYIAIIFYILCCKEKEKELRKDLPSYIADQKNEIKKKQERERVANDKNKAQNLMEQCGMKFFLKYYKTLLRLPVRDIEIDENYTPEEKNERLIAAKSLIEQGFSKYAAQHILDNYADLLTDDEKVTANEILSEQ